MDAVEAAEGGGDPPQPVARKPKAPVCTTDPDATLVTTNKASRSEPTYKQHTAADTEHGVILDFIVATSAMHDTKPAEEQLDAPPPRPARPSG